MHRCKSIFTFVIQTTTKTNVMIQSTTELKCTCCGSTFNTEYYHGGSIEHDNYTNDNNMNVLVNDFKKDDEKGNYRIFLDSITLDKNTCEMTDRRYEVIMSIFECRLKWLNKNGWIEVANYLESNRVNVKKEFNKVLTSVIADKQKEIDYLKNKLI